MRADFSFCEHRPRLDELVLWYRITRIDRGVEQSAAREAHNLKVAGSSPAPAILSKLSVLKHSLEMRGFPPAQE